MEIDILTIAAMVGPALLSVGLTLLINHNQAAKPTLVRGADYLEAVEAAVRVAEKSGLPGVSKFLMACDKMEAYLKAQGIEGNAARVTMQSVMGDIELVRARLFPRIDTLVK